MGLAVNLPILDPTLDLRIKGSEIQHQISKEEYRKVVLQAFEEVESALANLANRKAQAHELKRQIAQLQVVNDQTQAQLREGMVPQLELFESERSLLAAQQSLLQTNLQILQDTVTLYKALGGGWSKETVQPAKR